MEQFTSKDYENDEKNFYYLGNAAFCSLPASFGAG